MSDAIYLCGMTFEGHHGVTDEEREAIQEVQLDVELRLDLAVAAASDDIQRTVDYGAVFEICRQQAEEHSFRLLEALGAAVANAVLTQFGQVAAVTVDVRKPGVPIDGVLDHAGVRIERSRP